MGNDRNKLNAAADPFAAYLAAFHRNLHIEFAHDFLNSLPMAGDLGNPALVTMIEIVVNPDGSLDRVGVVKASGNLMYDFGAFNAVQRGAPYPPTPEKIRSPDGRVYIKWALHRNESQCGTWNAEPYILKDPPRSPNDPKQDNVSPYRPGATGNGPGGDNQRGGTPGKAPVVTQDETLGLLDNVWGLMIILMLINLPIVIWMLYTYFKEIPVDILEAARMDGATLGKELVYVLVPMAVPGIASTMLLNVILAWNEAFWTLNLTASKAGPLTAFIASYSSPEGLFYAKLSAASTMAIAPILILGWFSQKQLVQGLTFGAVK